MLFYYYNFLLHCIKYIGYTELNANSALWKLRSARVGYYDLHEQASLDKLNIHSVESGRKHGKQLDYLKRHDQAKIIKKTVGPTLFWLLDMTIVCQHVHRLKLRKFS